MDLVNSSQWESLERSSPIAFLVAGGLLTVYATLNGLAAFTDTAYLVVENIVGPGGFVLGFVGLLGLYPSLADRSPRLARAASVFVALGAVGFSAITVANISRFAGVIEGGPPAWFPLLLGLVVIGMIPGFVSFGVACLRTGVYARIVGLLLLAPPAIFAVMFTVMMAGYSIEWSEFAISSGQALAHLSIGYILGIRGILAERETTTVEGTIG